MTSSLRPDHAAGARLFKLLFLLWLVGAATRFTVLSVPPVLPSIHDDLHMSQAQVGFLVALPLLVFALASIPGSLLVARIGVMLTTVLGLVVTALGSAARGAAVDLATLYGATIVMGVGIAVIQPALPQLVQQWMPSRIALGTAVYTNGILIATTSTSALTIPLVLPLAGGSWRTALVLWSLLVVLAAAVLIALAPKDKGAATSPSPRLRGEGRGEGPTPRPGRHSIAAWWPDWTSPVIWLLGAAFAASNSMFFGANAFLPDYLGAQGRGDLISASLGAINGGQLMASFILLAVGGRMHRRAWPFYVFGAGSFLSLVAIMAASGAWVVALAALLGLMSSMTYVMLLALPAVLSRPEEVHRTAAGMFTISYLCGVVVPTISGALWDVTGAPWTAFIPLALCALVIIASGARLTRLTPPASPA